jgi:ketoreductase
MPDNTTRTALVTGASNGIGKATAAALGRQDRPVYICGRDPDTLAAAVDELRAEGLDVDGATCDVTDTDQVKVLVAACVERYGPIDVLVNNAGRPGGGTTADVSDELWFDTIGTNLNGTFLVTRAALNEGGMRGRTGGRIVNIASAWGKQGIMFGAPYAAAKHGVVGFTRSLALELARNNITVNAVCPGYVETPTSHFVRQCHATKWELTEAQVRARLEAEIPIGRYSEPDEVAAMVAYLCTDAAASVTGQALNICGGFGR